MRNMTTKFMKKCAGLSSKINRRQDRYEQCPERNELQRQERHEQCSERGEQQRQDRSERSEQQRQEPRERKAFITSPTR